MMLTALLEKDNVTSALFLATDASGQGQTSNFCGRSSTNRYNTITTAEQARIDFDEAVATSVDRGWRVVYYGPPLRG